MGEAAWDPCWRRQRNPLCPSFPCPKVMFTKQLCGRRLRTTDRVCPAGKHCAYTMGFSPRHLATQQTHHDFPGVCQSSEKTCSLGVGLRPSLPGRGTHPPRWESPGAGTGTVPQPSADSWSQSAEGQVGQPGSNVGAAAGRLRSLRGGRAES